RGIVNWMEEIFIFGEDAYGVKNDPSSARRRKARKTQPAASKTASFVGEGRSSSPAQTAPAGRQTVQTKDSSPLRSSFTPPPPIVPLVDSKQDSGTPAKHSLDEPQADSIPRPADAGSTGTETLMKYLTLGYGSAWTLTPKAIGTNSSDGKTSTSKSAVGNVKKNSDAAAEIKGRQSKKPVDNFNER